MGERRKVLETFEKQQSYLNEMVESGIERYRKGYGEIILKDADGNTVPNAKISIKQKTHEFKFGANLFMLDEFETEEKNKKYKEAFKDFFNMATLPFYWNATEPEKGKKRYDKNSEKLYRRPPIDLCMEFCEKHGIEPREHGLAYDFSFPKWLWESSVFEVKTALEQRYKEISERYKDKIRTIEVTNEVGRMIHRTAFYEEPDFVEWCFKTAEKYFPANELAINEYPPDVWNDRCLPTDKYYSYIQANLLKGARIDAIGMQFHCMFPIEDEYMNSKKFYNPMRIYKNLDMYSNFGKPLQISEVTIPAYSESEEDEEIQAKILENLYSLWFSHPNMEQIIYWNLVDGYAWVDTTDPQKIKESMGDMTVGENFCYGGLFRFDMTPKPAFFAIKNLIKNKWHTEKNLVTSEGGNAMFKGFYGKYDVEIQVDDKVITKEINLSKTGKKEFCLEV